MAITANRTNKPNEVMELAVMAKSIKGASIPRDLISKVVDLCMNSDYYFIIGSASTLSRKQIFFYEHKKDLEFYDKTGKEFELSDDSEVITENEVFMAIHFDDKAKEAHVYMYFPYDGAYI